MTFHDKGSPVLGLKISKNSQSTKSISGRNTVWEISHPHFQFLMPDKTDESKRSVRCMKNPLGQIGHNEVKSFQYTFGLKK